MRGVIPLRRVFGVVGGGEAAENETVNARESTRAEESRFDREKARLKTETVGSWCLRRKLRRRSLGESLWMGRDLIAETGRSVFTVRKRADFARSLKYRRMSP